MEDLFTTFVFRIRFELTTTLCHGIDRSNFFWWCGRRNRARWFSGFNVREEYIFRWCRASEIVEVARVLAWEKVVYLPRLEYSSSVHGIPVRRKKSTLVHENNFSMLFLKYNNTNFLMTEIYKIILKNCIINIFYSDKQSLRLKYFSKFIYNWNC